MSETKLAGLALLRAPFPANQISKLPKPTKQQTEEVKNDFKAGARCDICGGWHHPKVVHLDYVGHAALTDRLLDADPNWSWEPVAFDQQSGLPKLDANGGLWIKLTVCGVTRLGYGHADGKTGGDAIKEAIGDALRNAAMRFGAALDLWHKGDLHVDESAVVAEQETYEQLCERLEENIAEIKIGINKNNLDRAAKAWFTIGDEDKGTLWKSTTNGGCFTTAEREVIKSQQFRKAFYKD